MRKSRAPAATRTARASPRAAALRTLFIRAEDGTSAARNASARPVARAPSKKSSSSLSPLLFSSSALLLRLLRGLRGHRLDPELLDRPLLLAHARAVLEPHAAGGNVPVRLRGVRGHGRSHAVALAECVADAGRGVDVVVDPRDLRVDGVGVERDRDDPG